MRLKPGQGRRLRAGSPWAFSNEIEMKPEYRQMPQGVLVRLEGDDGSRFGTAMFNPHSLIAARLLDRDPAAIIDVDWLRGRLREAIGRRDDETVRVNLALLSTAAAALNEKEHPETAALPARIALYNRQVVSELRKVIWPTRNELVTYTIVSVTFVVAMIAFVGLLDYAFTKLIFKMFG